MLYAYLVCAFITVVLPTTGFRIVQYNVEWLFLDYYAPADCPGQGCTWKNLTHAQEHWSRVATVLNSLNPNLVNLCEIEGPNELAGLLANSSIHFIQGTDTATGQNVAMLTSPGISVGSLTRTSNKETYPIAGSKCGYTGSPGNESVSKHYITTTRLFDYDVAIIGAHLLAYPTDPGRCAQREAQSQVLQQIIADYAKQGYEILVMGDFNDYDGEEVDKNGDVPISQVLDILKGIKGEHAGEYELYSASELLDKEERWTDWWDKNEDCESSPDEFSMIDHILMSEGVFKMVNKVWVYRDYGEYCGKMDSDHYPVILDLGGDLGPFYFALRN